MAKAADFQGLLSVATAGTLLAERSGGEARMVLSGPATPLPSSALHPRYPGWALEVPANAQGSMEPALYHLFLTHFAGAKSLRPEEAQFGTLWLLHYGDLEIGFPTPPQC